MFRFIPLPSRRSGRGGSHPRPAGLLIALALLAALPAGAQIYVAPPPTGSDLNGDGSATAPYETIQHAFDTTTGGETIHVAAGTYRECLLLTGIFDVPQNQRSVHVVATAFDPGDESTRELTVITSQSELGQNLCTGLYSTINVGGSESSIEGFTITGGENGGVWGIGGVTITNNVIEGNFSSTGAGIYVYADSCYYSNPQVTISNNLIRNNTVDRIVTGVPLSGMGGGMLVGVYPEVYVFPGDPLSGGCRGGGATILVDGNTIESNQSKLDGGGVYAQTQATGLDLEEGRITITNNVISENTAGYQGDLAWAGGVFGYLWGMGAERIEIVDNDFMGNVVTGYGGGVWAGTLSVYDADHEITVRENTITGNSAGIGGGMEIYVRAVDLYPGQTVTAAVVGNDLTGNEASNSESTGGGGGLSAFLHSQRTAAPNIDFSIRDNVMRNNTADWDGAGVELRVEAEGEDFFEPYDANVRPATATVDFSNNLVVLNSTLDEGVGAGALVYLQSFGGEPFNPDEPSRARVDMEANTFSDNVSQTGAGGVEVEFYTGLASFGNVDAEAIFRFDSAIVSGNTGYGLGGPGLSRGVFTYGDDGINTANWYPSVDYTDLYGNTVGNYDTWVAPYVLAGTGNIEEDPLLDSVSSTYLPEVCSPTLDAANPSLDYSLEPTPNGGRANMGHTGGTAAATGSLADPSGDAAVDGIDVLRIAVAFGSSFGHNRWDAAADMDGSGIVDGDDLALVAAGFGQICP